MRTAFLPALGLSILLVAPLQAASPPAVDPGAAMERGAAGSMSEGTVKKVDPSAGKLTIAHGPLENLGMPAMTMVFRVKDPAMLAKVKTGDKIRFTAERVAGTFTVTALEPAK
jgi:Cu(I)/Ag(I) efflux system periplasmic protein CusF